MLFKKKKEEPPRVDPQSAAQLQALEQKVVGEATRRKEAEKQAEELRGQLKARNEEIVHLKSRLEALAKDVEKRGAPTIKSAEAVDPFAVPANADLATLETLLSQLDQKTGDIRAMAQTKRVEANAASAQRKVAELEKRLGDIDPLFAAEVDVLRKDVSRSANDLRMLDGIVTSIADLESREDAKREELLENLRRWKEYGLVVAPLETISAGSLADLDREFRKFASDVEKSNALLARLEKLQDVGASESIRGKLKDPTVHAQVEQEIIALEAAASSKLRSSTTRERERPAAPTTAPTPAPAQSPSAATSPAPTPSPAAPAGGEEDVDTVILKADELLERAKKAGKDVNTPTNLLRLAKSFQRSKNVDKARQYAERAAKMAEGSLQ